VGAGLQAQAANTANMINWMNLQFQKQQAAKQNRFARAARGDAYGNKQLYDELLNEWLIKLTPMQSRITKAGEKEQLLTLTEDAARARDIKRAQRARGIEAGKDYQEELIKFRYGGPRSELSMRDELTNLLAGIDREKANKDKTELMRIALRQNQGSQLPSIIKGINDDLGANLAENMLKAKQGAQQEFIQRSQFHQQRHLPYMKHLVELMDLGGAGSPAYSDTPEKLMALQQQQAAGIQAAMQSEAGNVGSAYKTLASGVGQGGAGIAAALKGLGSGFGGGGGGRGGRTSSKMESAPATEQQQFAPWDQQSLQWLMADPLAGLDLSHIESWGEF
jgi:hypothetical protein